MLVWEAHNEYAAEQKAYEDSVASYYQNSDTNDPKNKRQIELLKNKAKASTADFYRNY